MHLINDHNAGPFILCGIYTFYLNPNNSITIIYVFPLIVAFMELYLLINFY